jgi:UPF0755 protein
MIRALVRAFFALVFVVVVAAVGAALWYRQAIHSDALPETETEIVIPSGATGRDIAHILADRKVVSSAVAFELLARIEGQRSNMKAGEFVFAAHRPMTDVLHEVVTEGRAVAVWVTIPEGYTAREIARTLADAGLGSSDGFDATFLHTAPTVDGERAVNYEGFLFPETYLVPLAATPQQVATQMFDQFERELPPDATKLARALGLTVPQVVTVASIVEREAKVDDERALMAGVYYNRLRLGMPLQVDATIEYTFAHHKDEITYADLARDTPYNTYEHVGLPPTPIANPGRASLLAAFHPKASDYLYYVAMQNGRSAFSRTLAGHNANVAKYLK